MVDLRALILVACMAGDVCAVTVRLWVADAHQPQTVEWFDGSAWVDVPHHLSSGAYEVFADDQDFTAPMTFRLNGDDAQGVEFAGVDLGDLFVGQFIYVYFEADGSKYQFGAAGFQPVDPASPGFTDVSALTGGGGFEARSVVPLAVVDAVSAAGVLLAVLAAGLAAYAVVVLAMTVASRSVGWLVRFCGGRS